MSNHDRSVAILCDGNIIAAISEERIDRRKHSQGFYSNQPNHIVLPPSAAINYCLDKSNLKIDELDYIVVGRSITSALDVARKYIPIQDKSKIIEFPIPFHHSVHAASAYYGSGFDDSLIVVADEQGHWIDGKKFEKLTAYIGNDGKIKECNKQYGDYFNISLGMFYDLFSYALGFNDGGLPAAGKTMGLSAFGGENKNKLELFKFTNGDVDANIEKIIEFLQIHSVLDPKFTMITKENITDYSTILDEIGKYITPIEWNTKVAKDIAWKAQSELQNILIKYIQWLNQKYKKTKLCLAGGIFLNSVANGLIFEKLGFKNIYIFPASTDDGTAVGLAYKAYSELVQGKNNSCKTMYLGRNYSQQEIVDVLRKENLRYVYCDKLEEKVAKEIAKDNIIGFFHGSSEFGPRALGNRSILANPCLESVKIRVNKDIKHREAFRPLAPVVIETKASEYFDISCTSPYMLLVGKVKDESLVGIKHIDGTARVQTVSKEQNACLYKILQEYGDITKKYVLINTSFNVNGEPLVETPLDAICSFFTSDLDILFLENYMISKNDYTEEELERLHVKYISKNKETILKLASWQINNENYEKAYIYLNLLQTTNLFNTLNDNEKIELFYMMAIYYGSIELYDKGIEYLEKIMDSIYYNINFADIYLLKIHFMKKINKCTVHENKIAMELQKLEAIGALKYVQK